MKKTCDISLVSPVYNEEKNLKELYSRINKAIPKKYSWELIFIDDGSNDDSRRIIRELCGQDNRICGVFLSRNYGHQIALTAGYDFACGKAVVSLDSDLQHPPEFIPRMIEFWERGDAIVLARRRADNLGWFKKISSKLFYFVFNKIANVNIESNVADFRLMDRKVVDCFKQYREASRFIRGIIGDLGFKRTVLDYNEDARSTGRSKYSFWKMGHLAVSGIISFSTFALKIAIHIGLMISFCSLLYAGWIVYHKIVYGEPAGMASILVGIFFIGGIQLIFIGILGEYIGSIFTEVKKRPLYCASEYIGRENENICDRT